MIQIIPALLLAAPPAGDAQAFMDQVLNRSSWDDMRGKVILELKNARGDNRVRHIDLWSKTNAAGESRMLMRIVEPADVHGTGFLLIEHEGAEDDRRLFLPALRRARRISASGSGGNFMSSDFTYYDVGTPELSDWTYRFVDGKTIAGVDCRGVEASARSSDVRDDTGYARVVWYVDPARLVALGADYFDEANLPLKTLTVTRVELVSGVPFATRMVVTDVNTHHQSTMEFQSLETNTGIADDVFTERNLRRWRR